MTSNPCGGAYSPAWSPDGTTIAFVFRQGLAWAINTIRLADNDRAWVWYGSAGTSVADPAWSPDGTKIAFTATTGGQPRIMVKTLGTNMGVGVRTLADGKMPAWSPDGIRIAYVDDWWSQSQYGNAADGDDIYVIGACDDCQATTGLPLWQIAGRDWYPSWSADGTKILFQSENTQTPAENPANAIFHLWVMDPFKWDDPYPDYYWVPLDLSEFSAFMTWQETGIAYSDSMATWHWPMYDLSGLFSPVQWGFRTLKAGQAVPIKFSLGGDQGLDIFKDGFPRSVTMTDCSVREATGEPVETIPAGGSSLTYDPAEDQYVYIWKTDKSWRGCREFQLALKDGTYLTADFLLWR
jgi:dipeptidyl aminopeptidase/acylaminoacyl peptidase